jgi:hypothetical protein
MDGKEVRCPKGTYYIDYTDNSGKRVRTSVGTVPAEAQASRLRKEAELRALAQGLSVTPSEGEPANAQKRPIALAIVDFLEEVKLTKDPKTWKGYEIALGYFQESCPKVHLETLERKDLLKFAAFLKTTKKQSPSIGPQQVRLPSHIPVKQRAPEAGGEERPTEICEAGSRNL